MEEIKKIEVAGQQYGVADMLMRSVMGGNAQVIEWSHTHNMNDYKEAGTYRIKGERTGSPLDDNLPIMNQGSGHSIEGILYVLDSSLTNGSGNSDDCTVTQFLMLSNRVGGQEGDMYMRSAYGANKDSLTWKPWEKFQTNMEVGVVADSYTMNPQNPTQVIGQQGMYDLMDNGIYSGVYIGPKAMIGTYNDGYLEFEDPTGIETFVMVVINNYQAASNARCITQIKFAVTNGGVFSMEKRNTYPGTTTNWSQWDSAGGPKMYWNKDYQDFIIENPNSDDNGITIGSKVIIGRNTTIQGNTTIGKDTTDNTISIECSGIAGVKFGGWNEIRMYSRLGRFANIGDSVNINSVNDAAYGIETGIALGTGDAEGGIIKIGQNVRIPNNLKFSVSNNILTITSGTKTWKLTAES